jgi:phosphoribosylanthranilate isomerase
MFRIKICGLTRPQDVRAAIQAGADALGFQMSRGPRKITPEKARRLVRLAPPLVTPVGVFVDESPTRVKRLIKLCGFRAVQLHGDEKKAEYGLLPVPVIKAIRMRRADSFRAYRTYPVAAFLLDSYNKNIPGGTGQSFRYEWARKAVRVLPAPVLIAGGLNPANVGRALRASHAFGVDVASGVETRPGLKDPRKILLFTRVARKAFRNP